MIKAPKQINVPYLGALWELYNRVAGIYSLCNTFMIIVIAYSTNERIRNIFPTFWLFFGSLCMLGVLGAIFAYVFLLPSSTIFLQNQSVIDNRNPIYNKICENEQLLYEIKNLINDKTEK